MDRKNVVLGTFFDARPRAKQTRMTRQHFEAIAATLKAAKPTYLGDGVCNADFEHCHAVQKWDAIVEAFASQGYTWNANFNAAKFLAACGKDS